MAQLRTKSGRIRFQCEAWTLACALMIAALGCAPSGPDGRVDVSGTVTLDGEKMGGGDIVFMPVESGVATDAAQIANGAFQGRVLPGQKKVVIRWEREHPTKTMPGPDPNTTTPLRVQVIPQKYNDETELTADITGPTSSLDFALEGALPLD